MVQSLFFSLIGIDLDSRVAQPIAGGLRVELAEGSPSKHVTFEKVLARKKYLILFLFRLLNIY